MITRWPMSNVQNELNRLQNEMNRLFNRNPASGRSLETTSAFPAINLWEDGETFVVEAELPGMELDDLEIFVDGGNQLTLKGQRNAHESDQGTWHRRERGFGNFKRTITLPGNVDTENVEAVLVNGVLKVTLPKPEEVKPRKIQIRTK